MRLTQERMASTGEDVGTAQRNVRREHPDVASHYAAGKPLALAKSPTPHDRMMAELGASLARNREELAEVKRMVGGPAERPHYSQLSPAEQDKYLPRKLASASSAIAADEVLVHRLGGPGVPGSGFYAVKESGA